MTSDERMWSMFCHLAALSGYVGVPAGNILGPLVVWLLKKDEFPVVEEHGKEALNFQLSMTIYGLACTPLVFFLIGIPLVIAIAVTAFVCPIIAGVAANSGRPYRYPFTIRMIK